MVDTRPAMESDYIDAEFVDKSPTKLCVPTGVGGFEACQFDKAKAPVQKLTIPVEMDGKKKLWRPNKESVENLQVLGYDSASWVGQRIMLRSSGVGQYRAVIGYPADGPPVQIQNVPGRAAVGAAAPGSPANPLRKIPDSEIPPYAKGPGVEFSRGTAQAPPGYDDGGQF